MPYLTIKVANAGTNYIKDDGTIGTSLAGHTWISLQKEYNSIPESYGFAPLEDHQGEPFAPGKIHDNDDSVYILDSNDYQRTVYITEDYYTSLRNFAFDAAEGHGFSTYYFLTTNDCINFVWANLTNSGLSPQFRGDLIPSWNIDNFNTLLDGIEANIDPWDITLKYTTPNDLNLTNSQFISAIADYYGLSAVDTINFNQDYFSNVLGYNGAKISAHSGNTADLLSSSNFTLKNINLSDYIDLHQDSNGNSFSIAKDESPITLKDGTIAAVNTVIKGINSSIQTTANFLTFEAQKTAEIIIERIKSDTYLESLMGSVLADILLGENDPKEIAKHLAEGQLRSLATSLLDENIRKVLVESGMSSSAIDNLVGPKVVNYVVSVDASGTKITTALDANGNPVGPTLNGTIYTAILNFAISAADSSGWDSEEYAQAAKVAIASAIVSAVVTTVLTAIAPGIGTAAGIVISAVVCALVVGPLVTYVDDQYEITEDIFIMARDLTKDLIRDPVNTIEDFDPVENAKQLIEYAKDYVENVGKFGRNILIGGYNLFGGNYGQTYKPGQYPTPYPSVSITAKPDGTGNIIQGLDPQGVTAIAREYYHDDIYGTSGSDNLIGKSGTNTVSGYGGNDHIEGRGDIDLLIGGAGDDEVFGGNGDDQLYGSEGNDNLFGGNGNDIIIGGTGASISGEGSLEDGNDFIQGGNGDDQIMGEAGNDIIQGNAGNDTMLGGTGNDRIEGNEGDDSILGEDGDDMILGGVGSDIIDGGSGTDYIEGNEGNDNIRGGDGNDEISGNSGVDIIYGDAGNDLINTGSENDLAFGGLGNDIIYGADGDDTLSGELGNDYVIGADGADTIDGGAGDDILFGGVGNDTITTGEGNDTIIYRTGDGQDTITDTDTAGNDILRLTEINSKLSNNTTDKLVLTKSGTDLIIQFKDDSGSIISSDKITVTNQFGGSETNGTGSEILKKIEFADGKSIDLTNITINSDDSISYATSLYSNIDTSIQEELALGYNDQMQYQDEQTNPNSTYSANNYNSSGEQEDIDSEKFNDVQWRSKKERRSVFGGHYTVWYKYYESNLGGTNGNDRMVGSWWSENVYGGNGDDQLNGGDGNDNLFGGEGADILHGGAGNDNAYGQAGEDLIYGGSGNDNIDGGSDNDTIYANEGNDTVIGGNGDDYLEGNGGNDSITDNEGNNIIIAGGGIDLINAGAGNDKIEGNDDTDNINAGNGNNLVYGNGGSDVVTSGSGNDTIYGQEGNDQVYAGDGDDYISGGANDDILNGEDGNDTIFGDIGIDQISGGSGNDYIYGGSSADILKGDAGADQIKGGDSDDWIEGGADNDSLYGQSGSDKIYGDAGNDYIDGGIEGDVLDGGDGDDAIIGGQGNDILVDGAGSDTLDGGNDSDIIILTTEIDADGNTTSSTSIDTVKNFNKDEDKIILKVSYKAPITFADIQAGMIQNGSNVEIALDNDQQIIIENITTSDITSSNFQIGLSGGENNDILFGTDGEDVVFGNGGDDQIYGGEGNDELWGGKGSDELYGEGGDDILRYEADGKYLGDLNPTLVGYSTDSVYGKITLGGTGNYVSLNGGTLSDQRNVLVPGGYYGGKYYYNVGDSRYNYLYNEIFFPDDDKKVEDENADIFFGYGGSVEASTRYVNFVRNYENAGSQWYWIDSYYDVNFNNSYAIRNYFSKNFYNGSDLIVSGYNRTFDKFNGGSGYDTILMTEGNDALTLDDPTSASGSDAAGNSTTPRVQDISVIHAGAGDDVVNFTDQNYSYGDVIIYGGTGNDHLWSSSGNDQLFGGEGNDEIYSGAGNDELNGGSGDDVLYAGTGNDSLEGGSGTNQLFGEDGDDTFIAGSGVDIISGGDGSDTVSYVNSTSAVTINLSTNSISGGDAANDAISSIENITGSTFGDNLIGNSSANTLNGGSGDDNISGGAGSDAYIYNSNSGTDTITESGSDLDYIEFGAGISASDLTFTIDGNDLQIQVGDSASNKLILKDQILTTNRIEYLKFDDGSQISTLSVDDNSNLVTISEKFFIASEDVELAISNPLNESVVERRRFESLTALYGTLVFDEVLNQFIYKSNANFHGIDEVELVEEDGTRSKFTVFVNGVNDAPIFSSLNDIPNKEVKVEEEWSINLKDYFFDADGDNFTLSLKLQGFDNLPDWINFNSETGTVSGKIGRDGKLNFTVTATDPSGANLSDNFRINVTRSIADDIRPTAPIAAIIGTDASDIITATPDSSDIISGGAGDDTINYTKDNDWIESSDGSYYTAWNVYSGDEINVTGKQRSFDAFDGGDGYDKLNLTNQNDVIFLDDAIVSNVGDIAKISSIEEIDAGDGDDVVDLTSLTFSYDDVVLNGGNGDDVLWGNDGDDTINGDEGEDNLQGGKGDDTINGGIGNDTIKGYDGNDQINGGAGFDVMIGGDGSDQFIFTNKTDSVGSFTNLSETDIISDFVQNEDQIDLSALGFDSITQGQGSNSSADGLEFYFKDGYTVIDDPNSNFAVKLAGEIQLGASDFNF